ncbi:hypothetical protein BASA61_001962 [Batrachochytrium salamandrivorans]|nr:hypothetical protein BASA61_001962 [Batrachochytrium salamandrivorans]
MWYNACGPHTSTTVKATILPVEQSLETAAAETADQTLLPPAVILLLQYPHQVPFPSIQISLVLQVTTLPHPYPPAAVFIFHHHPSPNQLYSLHQQHPPKPNSPTPFNSMVSIYHLYPRVAYYGLELIGGNSTLARRLQAPVNTGIRMILKAPLFTPIAPMLTDCGIISLDAHAILARVRLTVKATTLKTPLRTLLLPSTIPSHSSSWFWDQKIPLAYPFCSSQYRSKYAFERTFQVWGKSKLACSYVQANHASSAKFLRSPALSTGQAIGASLLSLARCGGLWDYPRALKAGLLHPTATNP